MPTIEEAEATYVAEKPRGAKPDGPLRLLRLSLPKTLSAANAFKISDHQCNPR